MEKPKPDDPQDVRNLFRTNGGRDELNLAEFPITLLSDRIPDGCKTLVFEDKVFDQQAGEVVTRKVTVTGSDAYGLPTAVDDEILVALLQLTKVDGFRDPKVHFSRHEVLEVLGWKDVGKNYQRVVQALNRWMGVTLYYEKAWWDNELKAWIDAKFHILDNVTMISPAGPGARKRPTKRGLRTSWFKWNEVVFKSFRADNLKRLDLETYFNLKTSVAKRLFRFLDKRFYHRPDWEFELEEFAFQHVGLSGEYDSGQIKAKLRPGIEELEAHGFLAPLTRDERYTKVGKGFWKITLAQAKPDPAADAEAVQGPAEPDELTVMLAARDVSPASAADIIRGHTPEQIRSKIEVFDWLVAAKDKRVAKNPSGFLVSSIRDDYTAPKGFEPRQIREERLRAEAEAKRLAEESRKRAEDEIKAGEEADKRRVELYWATLSPEEQERTRARALAKAPSFLVGQYRRNEKSNPKRAEFYWQVILASFIGTPDGTPPSP